jgi:hypothetical protein
MNDDAIQALVARLARPSRQGGHTVERAAILAAGPDSAAVEAWILAHSGRPEETEHSAPSGLFGARLQSQAHRDPAPRRFLLPQGALVIDRATRQSAVNKELTNVSEVPDHHVHGDGQTKVERG